MNGLFLVLEEFSLTFMQTQEEGVLHRQPDELSGYLGGCIDKLSDPFPISHCLIILQYQITAKKKKVPSVSHPLELSLCFVRCVAKICQELDNHIVFKTFVIMRSYPPFYRTLVGKASLNFQSSDPSPSPQNIEVFHIQLSQNP